MKIRKLIVASLLSLGFCAAFAQNPGPGPDQRPGPRLSVEEREKRCQANPEKCAKIKERIEKRREGKQARRDEWKKKCEADPKACAEKKAQFKQKREERREARKERMQSAPQPAVK